MAQFATNRWWAQKPRLLTLLLFNRTQGPKESMDDYLIHLRGLIAMLKVRVPLAKQLDWAYRGLRPEFKKVIRKFEFRDFNDEMK